MNFVCSAFNELISVNRRVFLKKGKLIKGVRVIHFHIYLSGKLECCSCADEYYSWILIILDN